MQRGVLARNVRMGNLIDSAAHRKLVLFSRGLRFVVTYQPMKKRLISRSKRECTVDTALIFLGI